MSVKDNMPEKEELAIYVGNRIREFRKKKKLTQSELGKKINKKFNTISNYETGKISPEQDALFALSTALDVNIDEFFPKTDYIESRQAIGRALRGSGESDLDIEDMRLIQKITDKALELEGDERKKLMNHVKLALNLFDNMDN